MPDRAKLVAITGAPHSGKTMLTAHIASAVQKLSGQPVIMLFPDLVTPTLPILFPFAKQTQLGSVGIPLQSPSLDALDVESQLITRKGARQLGILGYRAGENFRTFPRVTKQAVSDLLSCVGSMCAFLFSDCLTPGTDSVLAAEALTASDLVLMCHTSNAQGVVFSQSCEQTDKETLRVLNAFSPLQIPPAEMGRSAPEHDFEVPFSLCAFRGWENGSGLDLPRDRRYEQAIERIAKEVILRAKDAPAGA